MTKNILMVAAECDALPAAKVGGIGDVLRDLPKALAQEGCNVHVVIPSYGYLHELEGSLHYSDLKVPFEIGESDVELYKIALSATKYNADKTLENSLHVWVMDNPGFYPGGKGAVYCDDGNDRPFASDASKYALFCSAVGMAINNNVFGPLDVLHLHDWHAATLAVLRSFDENYQALQSLKVVYSIHNLSLQGVRPFERDPSSLKKWFPWLRAPRELICDPRVPHCYNPMRAGINLSDKVHAVSPTYAQEIQKASDIENFIYGGEGLEEDLIRAQHESRLVGILNGCEYPEGVTYPKLSRVKLGKLIRDTLVEWAAKTLVLPSAIWVARERLHVWLAKKEKGLVVTSVGRLTEQKVRLLKHPITVNGKKQSTLSHLLDALEGIGSFILVGSGDPAYQKFLLEESGKHQNFMYLQGYSDELAQAIYASGDLFLMPSSFEPCGISQMLAMRAGQPCLVHSVGGLNDTVLDGVSGFTFIGKNGDEQAQNFLQRFAEVLEMAKSDQQKYATIAKLAAKARFTWKSSAHEYIERLYYS